MAKRTNSKHKGNASVAAPVVSASSSVSTSASISSSTANAGSGKTKGKRLAPQSISNVEPSAKRSSIKRKKDETEESILKQKKEKLEYIHLVIEADIRARFFRDGGTSKCHGCRINGSKMPDEPVKDDEIELLKCGCKKEDALLEEIYVKLAFIGKDVAKERKMEYNEKSGWKAASRPERERTLKLLDLLGIGISDLLSLVQD